jgi:hypothetical protein
MVRSNFTLLPDFWNPISSLLLVWTKLQPSYFFMNKLQPSYLPSKLMKMTKINDLRILRQPHMWSPTIAQPHAAGQQLKFHPWPHPDPMAGLPPVPNTQNIPTQPKLSPTTIAHKPKTHSPFSSINAQNHHTHNHYFFIIWYDLQPNLISLLNTNTTYF